MSIFNIFGQRLLPLKRWIASRAAGSRFLSGIYYALFSNAFRREQNVTLAGLRMHGAGEGESELFTLRRNVHGLEKGLLMRPRKEVFAREYIEETVRFYHEIIEHQGEGGQSSSCADLERTWFYDVLTEYFKVCGDDSAVARAREVFDSCGQPDSASKPRLVPFNQVGGSPPVEYADLRELAAARKSVRWFLPKSVDRGTIDKAIEIAAQAPSACNRQPYTFRVIDNPVLLKSVSDLTLGMGGYADQVPVLVAIVGQLRAFFDERDRHLIYVDGSLSAMSFLYAVQSLGLGACCINWPDIEKNDRAAAELLGLLDDERIVMLVALGYPDPEGMIACSQKKGLDQLRSYNRE